MQQKSRAARVVRLFLWSWEGHIDTAQARQPLRRDPTDRSPRALELVDLGEQRQDFGRE
jgi:hypothetical protein